MPIGGGSFTVQNKVLPGAYINYVSMGTNAKMGGTRRRGPSPGTELGT